MEIGSDEWLNRCGNEFLYRSILHFFGPHLYLLRSGTLMVKQISQDVLDGDSPGIPVQATFKSGSTRSRQLNIPLLIAVEPGNHFRIGCPSCIIGQQKPVFAISDHLWNPARIGSDDWQAEGVGLTEHHRATISSCWYKQEIRHHKELF